MYSHTDNKVVRARGGEMRTRSDLLGRLSGERRRRDLTGNLQIEIYIMHTHAC